MSQIKLYIGLDVHKNSIAVALAPAGNFTPEFYGTMGGSNLAVERGLNRLLQKFDLLKDEVALTYEAGPTGFVLARRLIELGYAVTVVAPTAIPSKSNDRVKTDKKDAIKLARLLRSGELDPIHIPEPHDEAVRDLCRARTDASQALARAKQQLGSFLLRNGVRYDGKTNWTQSHLNYLRSKRMQHPSQQLAFEYYLAEIDRSHEQVQLLEEQLKSVLPEWERAPYVRALMSFRGYQEVAAMTMIAELGDLSRFDHPKKLMAYLGVVPMEESSGSKRRQGAITKTGNSHARWMLIECSSHYSHTPKISSALSQRQKGQSQAVKAIAWRAQNRLHRRFGRLKARGLHRNRIITAIAREFCGFLWELHRQVESEVNPIPQVK